MVEQETVERGDFCLVICHLEVETSRFRRVLHLGPNPTCFTFPVHHVSPHHCQKRHLLPQNNFLPITIHIFTTVVAVTLPAFPLLILSFRWQRAGGHSWPALAGLSAFNTKHKGLSIAKPQGTLKEMILEEMDCACSVDKVDRPNEEPQTGSVFQRDTLQPIKKKKLKNKIHIG